jgi:hypothetical protein
VSELDRKLSQLEIMIERILEESQTVIDKQRNSEDKEELISEMQSIRESFTNQLTDISDRLHTNLMDCKQKIISIQTSEDQNQF